jgi:hypothetical protein
MMVVLVGLRRDPGLHPLNQDSGLRVASGDDRASTLFSRRLRASVCSAPMSRTRASRAAAAAEPDPQPIEPVADPFVIGPPSAPMTPGWLMGIGTRPETPAEHATRLGASAGTFTDAGFLLGNLAPRPEWPAQPPVVIPVADEP